MLHQKFLKSKCVGSPMIPAALLCVLISGCADNQPTGPGFSPPRVARVDNVPFNKFFVAWSRNFSASPIETQNFALDARLSRQFGGLWPEQHVLDFAQANRGHLYINGDEPDQYCIPPYEYAGIYRHFVTTVRGVDPTARFSPAGVAEPNDRCCPEPVEEDCRQRNHGTGYMSQFYDAYIQRFGSPPPVAEWRFHDFGLTVEPGDVAAWWSRVDQKAAWSVAHGANMVLGAWAFHRWKEAGPMYPEYMKQAMGRLMSDPRINQAVYWSYESWAGEAHHLANEDGSLTLAGQTLANPLTDVPTDLKVVGSADGQAKLRWTNTTIAWPAEVEFWVQAPGSDAFAYNKTVFATGAGSTETSFADFNVGDRVKARVRYYNRFGQAEWSPFSNIVALALHELDSNQRKGDGKRPLFCLLQLC